jgi:hypothetical protein
VDARGEHGSALAGHDGVDGGYGAAVEGWERQRGRDRRVCLMVANRDDDGPGNNNGTATLDRQIAYRRGAGSGSSIRPAQRSPVPVPPVNRGRVVCFARRPLAVSWRPLASRIRSSLHHSPLHAPPTSNPPNSRPLSPATTRLYAPLLRFHFSPHPCPCPAQWFSRLSRPRCPACPSPALLPR